MQWVIHVRDEVQGKARIHTFGVFIGMAGAEQDSSRTFSVHNDT